MEKPQLLLMQIMAIEMIETYRYRYISIYIYRERLSERSKVARRTVETCGGSDLKAAKAQYSV